MACGALRSTVLARVVGRERRRDHRVGVVGAMDGVRDPFGEAVQLGQRPGGVVVSARWLFGGWLLLLAIVLVWN